MATTGNMFRICPRSGLQFHKSAEPLIKLNAVAAVVALLVGGVLALLVLLTRWQAVHLIDADNFYLYLTAHGLDMLVIWIIFFEIAILYFCSSTLLRCRLATPRLAWLAFALMIIGTVTFNVAIFAGKATVMMTSYVPMQAHPAFYLGLILFAVGALIACFVFLGTLVVAKAEKTYEGSIPLVTFGALTAAIIAIFTIASGAIILIPTFLWSAGYISHIDPAMYRLIWWGFGHSSQQINVAAHIAVWYAIAAIVFGAKPMSERVSRIAFVLYICFLQLASAHHLLADPAVGHRVEGVQHQLRDVPRGARVDDPRPDGAGCDRGRAARQGLHQGPVRVDPQGAVEQSGLLRHVHLADRLRLPRRHLGRDDGHRAAEHADPQHDLRAGALPRDRRHRHHAGLHVADLLPGPGAVQPRDDQPRSGEVAALPVRAAAWACSRWR